MRKENEWTNEMFELLFFMKDILGAKTPFCVEVLKREYPNGFFTNVSVRVKYSRLKKLGWVGKI